MILPLKSTLIILTLSVFYSCAPSRFVQPLEKDEKAITASLGGPLTQIPGVATIPIPHTNITYGQGITDKITVFGGWIFKIASIFFFHGFSPCGVSQCPSQSVSFTPHSHLCGLTVKFFSCNKCNTLLPILERFQSLKIQKFV